MAFDYNDNCSFQNAALNASEDNFSSAAAAVIITPGLSDAYQWALIAVYGFTTSLAVLGNTIVIGILLKGLRSRTDLRIFLINLAIADLTMAVFCMPFTFTTTMLHDWVFGTAMCTIVLFLQMLSVTASVSTSTALAVTRYIVVTYPLRRRYVSRRRTRLGIVASVWIVSSLLSAVQLFVGRTETVSVSPGVEVTFCMEVWPQDGAEVWRTGYTFFVLATTYLLPLLVIAPTYGCIVVRLWRRQVPGNADRARDRHQLQTTRRVIKMLAVMVTLFAICWLPLHMFTVVVDFVPGLRNENSSTANGTIVAVYTAVHWLAMSNSLVNPIVHCFLNDNFRSDLRRLTDRVCDYLACRRQPDKSASVKQLSTARRINQLPSYAVYTVIPSPSTKVCQQRREHLSLIASPEASDDVLMERNKDAAA